MEVTGNILSFDLFGFAWNIVYSLAIGVSGIIAGVFIQGRK